MTLKEYFEQLQEFINENPDALELEVITSKDDEGNGYNEVFYGPSLGQFDDNEFIPHSQFEEWGREDSDINAVCLN
jgi:hypothetical protein